MSGGAWEYVMANYNDIVGRSGFGEPLTLDSKYYNKYTSITASEACDGGECYSYALSETAGWYSDYQVMTADIHPWMIRGGYDKTNPAINAGIFYFHDASPGLAGEQNDCGSFRLVATIR